MWEYEVIFKNGNSDSFFIWGYNFEDACDRNRFNPNELVILFREYID